MDGIPNLQKQLIYSIQPLTTFQQSKKLNIEVVILTMIYYLKIEHIIFLIPSIKCTRICYSTPWESLISLYFILLELFFVHSGLQRSWCRYTHERRVELFLRSCWTWLPGIDFVCQLLVNSVNTFTVLSMAMEKNCELGSYSDSSLTEKDKYWYIIGNPRPV